MNQLEALKRSIRTVVGFPRPGINFRDIDPLVRDPARFREAVEALSRYTEAGAYTTLAGIDARGFLFAGALAFELHLPLIMIRKAGKLPPETIAAEYELEYGSATVEASRDHDLTGQRCLLIDDLLATGGTALAATRLLRTLGAEQVGFATVITLRDLPGADRLRAEGVDVFSLCSFSEDEG